MKSRLLAVIGIATVVAVSCSDDDGTTSRADDPARFAAESLDATTDTRPSESDPPTTTTEQAPLDPTDIPGEPINRYNLSPRDCFDEVEDRRDGLPVTITTKLPCDEPHRFEVYAMVTYPADHPSVYPGDRVVRDFAVASCYREFVGWVGGEYETSELEIGVIIPNQENFEGDSSRYRGIHCWVERVDGEPMVGTSRNSGW